MPKIWYTSAAEYNQMKRNYASMQSSAPRAKSGIRPYKKPRYNPRQPVRQNTTPYQQVTTVARNIKKGVDSYFQAGASSPDLNTNDIVSVMTNNSFVYPVNLIQAGSGSWQRVGRAVTMKSIRLKGNFTLEYNNAISQSDLILRGRKVRALIVYDKQPNGTIPIKSDIIQYKNQAGTESGFYDGLLSYDNMERFTILRDMNMDMNWGANFTSNDEATETEQLSIKCSIDEYVKIGLSTNYKAESSPAVIGDISTGALYIVFLTDVADSTDSPLLSFNGIARLRYSDQ